MEELRREYRFEALDKLVRDLARVGDTEPALVKWLGHPIPEMTGEEYHTLSAYLVEAEEATRQGKKTPHLPPVKARKR